MLVGGWSDCVVGGEKEEDGRDGGRPRYVV